MSITLCTRASLLSGLMAIATAPAASAGSPLGSAIFIHPDGASAATWAVGRAAIVGPDADLEWDQLPYIAVYRGHMADSLTATSNGGATTHAYGVKVGSRAFGLTASGDEGGEPIVDGQGRSTSVAHQALRAGLRVGLVQSGTSTEPGTACFVASVPTRTMHNAIAAQLVESGVDVILGGGEQYFVPIGSHGRYGPGVRKDGRNLLDEARDAGYTIVRSREELRSLPADATRVLGLFAAKHTFNAMSEEDRRRRGLPLYWPEAPTIGEMTAVALEILGRDDTRFLLVVEEEGTDNFGNANNAAGVIEAMRRADESIAVARRFVRDNPDTLLISAADSDAGGMRMIGVPSGNGRTQVPDLAPGILNGAPLDGRDGTGTPPFIAAPDRFGQRHPFWVVWAAWGDVTGGMLVRAEGLNAHYVRGSMDNTQIADLIRLTLLGPGDSDDLGN